MSADGRRRRDLVGEIYRLEGQIIDTPGAAVGHGDRHSYYRVALTSSLYRPTYVER